MTPRTTLAFATALALLLPAGAAGAQGRDPAGDRVVRQLAETLGEAHGLKQICRPGDQGWRNRMARLIELEAPEPQERAVLTRRFNAGFQAARRRWPSCVAKVFLEEARVARRGRELSELAAAAT